MAGRRLLSSRLPKYSPPSVFSPFLRRFTDEKARDLAETIALYRAVQNSYSASVWAAPDIVDRVHAHCVDVVSELVELPNYGPLMQAFDRCQKALIEQETTIFSFPEIDWSRAHLSMVEQVDLNRFLRAKEYFLANDERVYERFVTALCNLSGGILADLPPLEDDAEEAPFTVPLINIVPRPNELVDKIIGTINTSELMDVGLFTTVQARIYENICRYSGVPPYEESKKPLIPAAEADLAPLALAETYLAGTPLLDLLQTPVPFALPEETRFAGHWIIAPPGRGKTVLLSSMFLDDLRRDASIIVMDSKGDLIEPIKRLEAVRDRIVLIEPDADFPLALNPLDIPKAGVAHTISLLEYVMSSLLEAKMTPLQTALFRKLLPAFIAAVPNPTLETFKDVLLNGMGKYHNELLALDPELRQFFADKRNGFDSKTYAETRSQLTWRLDFLLSNPILKSMFASLKTKLDIGKEMDAGKIILINNSKAMLGDEGAEFFGRFFIALILAAAQQRAGRRPQDKLPVYCYIDECHSIIARDPKIATILDECRSQKIALILAHQRSAQLTPPVLDAVSNCAIRFANSDDEAKFLANKLRTTADFLYSLPRGTFAAFVRDLTPRALALEVPYVDLSELPQMTAAEQRAIRERMRQEFSVTPAPPPAAAPKPDGPATRTRLARPATQSSSAGPAPPPPRSPVSAPPQHDPHTGAHTEPASKWGD